MLMRTSCSLVVLASFFLAPLTLDAYCFPLAALNCLNDLTVFVTGLLGPGTTLGVPPQVSLELTFPLVVSIKTRNFSQYSYLVILRVEKLQLKQVIITCQPCSMYRAG